MSTITFYGASDDLVEVDGDVEGCDEYNGENASFEVAGLVIEVDYHSSGCWGIRVIQVDESELITATNVHLDMPAYPKSGTQGEYPSYSVRLVMDVPDDSIVKALVQ